MECGKKVPRTDWLADLARGHSFPLREARGSGMQEFVDLRWKSLDLIEYEE